MNAIDVELSTIRGELRGGNKSTTRVALGQSCPQERTEKTKYSSRSQDDPTNTKEESCIEESFDQDVDSLSRSSGKRCCRSKSVKRHQQQQIDNAPSTLSSSSSGDRVPRVKQALLSALAWIMGDSTRLLQHSDRKKHKTASQSSTDNKRRVVINVSGKRFETFEGTLQKSPNSLLALPQREFFYDHDNKEYFFDRNRKSFAAILTYCQSGVLIKPPSLDERIFCAELRFFGFDAEADAHSPPSLPADSDRILPKNKIQRVAWELFEYPDTSLGARIVALFSVSIIILSIIMFCVETLPEFRLLVPVEDKSNGTRPIEYIRKPNPKYEKALYMIECVCIAWFTLEYLVRLASSPQRCRFLYQLLNIIDVIAILPFYITLILSSTNSNVSSLSILRVLRLVRVFRIFKLSRYSKGLKILGYTFRASLQELGLLAFFLVIGIVLFASAAYYCEESVPETKFESIPHSFWWAIVTMTTVGYGDMYPETLGGKLVGSFCVLIGVLAIAFPVPVIVNNFTYYYTLEQVAPDPVDDDYACSPLGRGRKISSTWSASEASDNVHSPLANKSRGAVEEIALALPDKSNGGTEMNGNEMLNIESNV